MRLRHLALPLVLLGAAWNSGCGSAQPSAPPIQTCTSNSVFVAWDAPMDSGNTAVDQTVGGFYVYVGTAPQSYTRKIRVGVAAPVLATYAQEATGLGLGTYYFTVTAFNGSGESAFASEATWTFSACGVQAVAAASSH